MKKIISKALHDEFVLESKDFNYYNYYCEELNKTFLLPVGQLYIVGELTDDEGNDPVKDLVEAEQCAGCGDIKERSEMYENDNGKWYCDNCIDYAGEEDE